MNEPTYSSKDVCEITGVTYRKLDYWLRTGLVFASVARAAGSGSRRRFSIDDVAQVRRVKLASDLRGGSLVDALDYLAEVEIRLTETSPAPAPA